MTTRAHLEDDLQIAVADFLHVALPPDAFFHHSPNGGWRKKREAARFKAMGVKAGFPDIIIFWRNKSFAVELKVGRNSTTAPQIACHAALMGAGCDVAVCRSVEDVSQFLTDCGVPLRATVTA